MLTWKILAALAKMSKDDFIEFNFAISFKWKRSNRKKNNPSSQLVSETKSESTSSLLRGSEKNGKTSHDGKKVEGKNKASTPRKDKTTYNVCPKAESAVMSHTPRKSFLKKAMTLLFGFIILPTFIRNWDFIEPISQLIIWLRRLIK